MEVVYIISVTIVALGCIISHHILARASMEASNDGQKHVAHVQDDAWAHSNHERRTSAHQIARLTATTAQLTGQLSSSAKREIEEAQRWMETVRQDLIGSVYKAAFEARAAVAKVDPDVRVPIPVLKSAPVVPSPGRTDTRATSTFAGVAKKDEKKDETQKLPGVGDNK